MAGVLACGRDSTFAGGRLVAEMSGSVYLAEALAGYGVTHVFLVPYVASRALAEMERRGIRGVSAHSELAAVYMADGYARAAHRPGVAMSQAIGASNLAAGLRDPYLGCSPVIAVSGGPNPDTRYRQLYQEVEDFPMFNPVTKRNMRVEKAEQLPTVVSTAFRAATSGTPGPVHIELAGRAGDVLDRRADLRPHIERRFGSVPPVRPEPDRESIAAAVAAIAGASRPVVVAGGGVIASGAECELRRFVEQQSLPVITTLSAKDALPDGHPLCVGLSGTYGRWCANKVLSEADLVVWVGSRAGGMVTDIWKAPAAGTPGVYIDITSGDVGRDYPVAACVVADARAALRVLAESAWPIAHREQWGARVTGLVAAWRESVAGWRASDASPIHPARIARELGDVLPADGVVVSDTGHSAQWTGTMLWLREGQRYIRCAGSLGWGFPGAIGVKCALPDRQVVCFTGDGGFYYHLSELETAARLGINVVVVVNNNGAFSQTRRGFRAAYADAPGPQAGADLWQFRQTDFAAVARAMGCSGERVTSPAELRPALERAFAAGVPAVIDVLSDVDALPSPPWGGPD